MLRFYLITFRKIFITIVLPSYIVIRLWPDIIMPFVTLLALIVALFREKSEYFYIPPNLEISVSTNPIHFHEVDATDRQTGIFVEKQTWLGLTVENTGIGIAKNLEVYFTGLESNTVEAFERYISLPLVRSWVGGTVLRSLPREVPLRFDICLLRSSEPEELNFRFIQTPNALSRIKCVPNKKSKFKFEVKVIADNSKVTKAVIEIEHGGTYNKNFTVSQLD